jgi:hypothetical protein
MVEGIDGEMSSAFATFAAHFLAVNRLFGQSSLYATQWASRANLGALAHARHRVIQTAKRYVQFFDPPDFSKPTRDKYAEYKAYYGQKCPTKRKFELERDDQRNGRART